MLNDELKKKMQRLLSQGEILDGGEIYYGAGWPGAADKSQ
jgi:hypothetical protein